MSARTLDVVAMSENGDWFAFPNEGRPSDGVGHISWADNRDKSDV